MATRWAVIWLAIGLSSACHREDRPAEPPPGPGIQPPPPPAPIPPPVVTGTALALAERRVDVHLRHGPSDAVGISRDGRFGASGDVDGTVAVWDLRRGRAIRWIDTPDGQVRAVAISHDGARLATVGWRGELRVWDVASGAERWSAPDPSGDVAFTAGGERLVGAHQIWDSDDGRLVWSEAYDYLPTFVTPDGRRGVNVRQGHLRVFELEGGKELERFEAAPASALAMSASGKRVAVLSYFNLVVFSSSVGPLAELPVDRRAGMATPHTKVLVPDDDRYVVTWDEFDLYVWSVRSGRELWRLPRAKVTGTVVGAQGGDLRQVQLAGPDTIAVSHYHGVCAGYGLADGVERWRREDCARLVGAPEAREVLLLRESSALDVVEVASGASLFPSPAPPGPRAQLMSLTVSPDGAVVAGIAGAGSLWTWDATTARPVATPPALRRLTHARFLADGRLAIAGQDAERGGLRGYRYDFARGAIDGRGPPTGSGAEGRRGAIENAIDFPEDARGTSCSWSGDRVIVDDLRRRDRNTVVDLGGGAAPHPLPRRRIPPGRSDLHLRDGTLCHSTADAALARVYFATDAGDIHAPGRGTIHAWDLRSGAPLAESRVAYGSLRGPVLSPDERHLVVAPDDGPVVLLDTATLDEVRRFPGAPGRKTLVALSPDGALVVAGARDGLFVWRLADGARLATADFSGTRELPTAAAFAPDGTSLWIGTSLGNLYRFRVAARGAP